VDTVPVEIRQAVKFTANVKPLIATLIPTYICPSDLTPNNHPKSNAGRSNYAGNFGNWNDGGAPPPNKKWNGMLGRRRCSVRLKEVTDGLSNTILVGEVRGWDPFNFFKDKASGTDFGSNARYFPVWVGQVDLDDDWDSTLRIGGDGSLNLGGAGQAGPRPINSIAPNLTDMRGQCFGSLHGGGANFVLGDGSVRYINESINLAVYQGLCCRNDGKAISAPD